MIGERYECAVRSGQTATMPAAVRTRSSRSPILLIPPSEGKAAGGFAREWTPDGGSFGALADQRAEVVAALACADGGNEKLLGLTKERLLDAQDANRELLGAPSLPAWRRYTGVVWEHLDPATLSPAQRRQLIVPSGLMGLVRGDDPVPPYRLRMGVRLEPLGVLSKWWRPAVSAAIERRARGRGVVDLLPKEHRAGWTPAPTTHGLHVELIERTGKPGGHFAKAAKGRLARAILLDGIDVIEEWEDERFDLLVTDLHGA